MRTQSEYHLHLGSAPDQATAEKVFDLVWRFDFTAPGFCLLDIGPGVDSHTLRAWMVDLKGAVERDQHPSMAAGRSSFGRWHASTSRRRRSSTWTALPNNPC